MSLPKDKIKKVRQNCQRLLANPVVTVRKLAKFLGLLSSSIQAVFPAPLHYRYLQHAKNTVLKRQKSYEALVSLDSEALQEVQWWRDNLVAWNGKALLHQSMDLTIETDASLQGWGPISRAFQQGAMVSKGKHVSYKLFRTASRVPGCQMFYQTQSESPGTLINGQCYRSNIHKQNGGNPVSSSLPAGQGPVGLVPEPQCTNKSSVPPRCTKRACRSRIQTIPRL